MLMYCPLNGDECNYRYCPCFTGNEREDKFGCKLVTAIDLYIKDMNTRMTVSSLAQNLISSSNGINRILMEDDCK